MKVIIAGSRSLQFADGFRLVDDAVRESGFTPTEIVSGTAAGIDTSGEMWAKLHNVPVKRFPAEWDKFGKSAGPRRNTEMASYADALIAVYDGSSRGTSHMIHTARDLGIHVFVLTVAPRKRAR